MKEFIVYTAARFGLFAVAYLLVLGAYLLLGPDGPVPVLWPLLIAAVLSTVASVYLLKDMRERFALKVQERADRMSRRFEEMKAKEDHD